MRCKAAAGLILAAGMLSGCTTMDYDVWGMRYGPQPVLVAQTVQENVVRQAAVVAAVAGALNPRTGEFRPEALPPEGLRPEWYKLILMGFNTIDDACVSYIDSLWIMERQKTRNSLLISAGGAVGAALLSAQVTPQTAAALLVLSQAFGFAGILNNAIYETYLYSQNAATIKKLLQKTTAEYRADFARKTLDINENEISYPIASPGAAYHHMREYLALCLPPTIQAQIEVLVGKAIAVPDDLLAKVNPGPTAPIIVESAPGPKASPAPRSRRVVRVRPANNLLNVRPTTPLTFE